LDSDWAYCTLHVVYTSILRNKITGEPLEEHGEGLPLPRNKVEEHFSADRKTWEASKQLEQLKNIFTSRKTPPGISKIIGFGCGRISSTVNKEILWNHTSSFQHALILSLRDILSEKMEAPDGIDCYAQDPIYSATDKSVLEASGIKILEDPEGFIAVDDSSVVFTSAPNVPVKQIVTDIARPAIIIWNKVRSKDYRVNGKLVRLWVLFVPPFFSFSR
jgi:hypothetical protein